MDFDLDDAQTEAKTTYPLPYQIRLTDEQIKRLGKLTKLYEQTTESQYVGQLIDRAWEKWGQLAEYMEAE